VVRLFFDILHGIDRTDIPLLVALEFAVLLGYDGQLKQNSDMEKELFQGCITQLKQTKTTKLENAMIWLYVKTWGMQGQHVIEEDVLWNFNGEDLESAIMGIAYPRTKNKVEKKAENKISLVEELTDLIMGKFGEDKHAFYAWSRIVHEESLDLILNDSLEDSANENTMRINGPIQIERNKFVSKIDYNENFEISFECKATSVPLQSYHEILSVSPSGNSNALINFFYYGDTGKNYHLSLPSKGVPFTGELIAERWYTVQ